LTANATSDWLTDLLGQQPRTSALFDQALTHGSASAGHYERLEFLGDRVLGLVIAQWLYTSFPDEKEGQLSARLNQLVAGSTCAAMARIAGVQPHLRLGKQARDDGARESDNVLGDVMEALIGATWLDFGFEAARDLVLKCWSDRLDGGSAAALKHPKSALQEWAAANRRRPPEYRLVERSGPHHAQRFVVAVMIHGFGEAQAEGNSKQEAETAAAAALLEKIG
jgi:ribonuclease III